MTLPVIVYPIERNVDVEHDDPSAAELNWVLDQPCRVLTLAIGTDHDAVELALADGRIVHFEPDLVWLGPDEVKVYLIVTSR